MWNKLQEFGLLLEKFLMSLSKVLRVIHALFFFSLQVEEVVAHVCT